MSWFKKMIVPLAALEIMNYAARSQDNTSAKNYSLSSETMLTAAEEGRTLRLSGYGDLSKGWNIFGFIDAFGETNTKNTYSEVHLSRNIVDPVSYQAEINSGLIGPSKFRTGPKFRLPTPKNIYADVKILPVNVSTEDGLLKETQLGFYGKANVGDWYLANWTDHGIRYGKEPYTLTEFTAGKKINDNFSLQTQMAKDTNSPGWAWRFGGKYKIF